MLPGMTSFICKQYCDVLFALLGSLQVLTAGIDGQLHLLPMQWERGSETSTSQQTCYSDAGGYVSYYDAQWASIDTFVTASTTGQCHIFRSSPVLNHLLWRNLASTTC